MASVFDAAKYIPGRMGKMSTLKLHKLCYYAQAWSLAWDGAELFPEVFEATESGPVCLELRNWHAGRFKVSADDVPAHLLSSSCDPFSADQKETLDAIIRDYRGYTDCMLREIIRGEDPWREARLGLNPERSHVISTQTMRKYYDAL